MTGSTVVGVLVIPLAVAVFFLVGLFYLGDKRKGPPNGSDTQRLGQRPLRRTLGGYRAGRAG